ncbi:aspartate dehydrogenase [Gymnodinialimonas ceratoperidinii]|uniref:L-aspartate dehydrogenase n=1 Tax=Gymnodinialimonas ceratoperidinii TaxID=2856823 RepID=A0A8F6Y9T8_9RHOB|nr:aspartate dehydrogenase [Gymnodinialimonas ceratoperidinii]QXT38241.1 aspartate dehydrogenase [Gymnodinialimonas ceratoperidinii]
MSLGHVVIIGFGAIAQDLVEILRAQDEAPGKLSVLVRPERVEEVSQALGDRALVSADLAALLAAQPDVVVECAGHGAVTAYGPEVLQSGTDLVVASVGALADAKLAARLAETARQSGAQCVVPSGAIGGIDALGAARLSGLTSVRYTGTKPPSAWSGTPAEEACDLAALSEPFTFFEGTAREAAQAYPKNANVAATLALAGLGMDETTVSLVADPGATENVHSFSVASQAIEFSMRLVGKPSPLNPKTSRSTVYSIARAVLSRRAAIVI